jgi:CrcB protein
MAEVRTEAEQVAVDPDVDLHVPAQRMELRTRRWGVLGAISAGGGLGGLARYALGYEFPATHHGFPWTTFAVNVVGCLLIGVLMVLVSDVWRGHRLVRPFLGVGVLGGFTTFSTYVVDVQRLVDAGAAVTGLAYLVATVVAALAAVYTGVTLTRAATVRRRAGGAR